MSEHELWNELGNLYFLSGSYDQAIRAYNRAIDLSPETGEPYSNLALTYAQMGKYSEASDFYQRGIRLLSDELDKAVSLHKLGDVYLHLKQFPQAAEIYQQTEELVPDLGQIIETSKPSDLLLHCPLMPSPLFAIGDTNGMVPSISFETGAPPFVEELTPWWFDGQVEPDEAPEPDYDFWYIDESGVHGSNENIISTEPLNWEPEKILHPDLVAHDLQAECVDADAVMEADTLSTNDTNLVETNSASVSQETVMTGEAHQSVDENIPVAESVSMPVMIITDEPEIVTESPDFSAENMTSPEAVQYETLAEWPTVELSQAEKLEIQADINKFKRVLEINPRNAFAWDTLGGNYKALGQYDDAIQAFQKAVSLDSTKAFYFHHLGLVYAAVGRYEDAINAFERVIEVDPNHSLAHATLGGYYRKNGNEELAKQHIEKARNLLANDENEYNRACMEAICGNTDHSLELLEIALKNKQAYVNWARKDPDLDFIRSDPRFHELLAEYAMKPA